MDADTSVVDERDAVAALRQVILSVRTALELFEDRIEELLTLDASLTDAETKKAVLRLRDAFQALIKERQSFEKEFYGRSGVGIAEPIDLDAARAEIGRLLDRIRDAPDPGRLPE